jgi:hypothetical protein
MACSRFFVATHTSTSLLRKRTDVRILMHNYARIHKGLRITPAMATGLSDHVWTLEEIVMMADSYMPQPAKRGPYKKKPTE